MGVRLGALFFIWYLAVLYGNLLACSICSDFEADTPAAGSGTADLIPLCLTPGSFADMGTFTQNYSYMLIST